MAEELNFNIKTNIEDAAKDAEKLGDNIEKAKDETEKLEGATKKGTKGFKGIGMAVKGFGMALKAAGIGLIVGLLAKLMQVFGNNQKVVDTFNTTMTGLSIAFNDLFRYINDNYETIKGYLKGLFTDPLGELAKLGMGIDEFMIKKLKGAKLVLEGISLAMLNISNPKKYAEGLAKIAAGTVIAGKEIADIYKDIESSVSDYVGTVADQAKELTELEKRARAAATEYSLLNAEFLKEAELQRQIRDDVSKTFAVRLEANEKIAKILDEQEKLQREAIQKQVDDAFALHNIDKTNLDNKIAYNETLVAQAELEEAIGGQRSEQLTNQVGLEEELRDAQAQTLAEGMSGMKRELQELENAYVEKIRLADKAGMDTTAITKQHEKQKSDVVREGVNAQLEAFSGLAGALGALAGESKELAIAQAVIDTYVGANKAFAQGGILGFVSAAAIILSGLANVKKIMEQDVGAGAGGGSMPSAAPSTPTTTVASGAFTLGGGIEPEPTRAYVVSDDITDSQNALSNIRRRATI